MQRYIKLYLKMISANVAVLASYRVAFINMFLVGIVWGSFLLISTIILTTKISGIAGWSRSDLILLAAMYNIVMGVFYTLIAPNFHSIPEIMQYGKLDLYLLRPIDAQFLLHWRTINLGGLGRIILGTVAIAIILNQHGIYPSVASLLSTFLLVLLSCLFLYGVWSTVSCVLFWQNRLKNIIELLYTTTGFGRYPRETIVSAPFFLTLVATPFFLTVSTPTRMLLGNFRFQEFGLLIAATVISLVVSRIIWLIGLRSYVGASS